MAYFKLITPKGLWKSLNMTKYEIYVRQWQVHY